MKILYVDSARSAFEKFKGLIESRYEKAEVSWAGSAVPAQMIMEKKPFDAIICVYWLSDLDGLTLLKRLRKSGDKVPFVLLTGQDDEKVCEDAMKLGATFCIRKENLADEMDAFTEHLDSALQEMAESNKLPDEMVSELKRQAAFFRINPAPVMQSKNTGEIIDHNPAAREIFGHELKGKLLTDLFDGLNLYDIQIISKYGMSQIEQQIGENTYLFTIRSDTDSDSLYVLGTDISDRILAENEVRKAHTQNEMLLSSISSIFISIDHNGYIRQWNSVAEKMFGIKYSDNVGKKFVDSGIKWKDPKTVDKVLACLKVTKSVRLDSLRFTRPNGNDGFLTMSLSPIKKKDGSPGGLLMLGDDITEQKILEDQLSQAQKLEAIGQLAAGIAHEINTPTQYIGDNTHFLQEAFTDIIDILKKVDLLIEAHKNGVATDVLIKRIEEAAEEADIGYLAEEVPTAIQQSLEGIERVSKIVKAMKDFSHPGSEEKTSIDINKAITSTVTVAKNEWKYVADMELDLDETLMPIPCYPGELNQVFLNIITNAAHAISDVVGDGGGGKGKITIKTEMDGDHVKISIKDTGTGIPEKIRQKIFQPFFTTKEVGKGTGQGLAISHSVIVEKHGGTLAVDSEEGKGTTFIIRLPMQA